MVPCARLRDGGIVERVDEDESSLRLELASALERLHPVGSVLHDLGAVAAARFDLAGHRDIGHDDHRVHACRARGPRERLCVIAGRKSDDARRALPVVELAQLVEGSSDLERSGLLKILTLEKKLNAGAIAETRRGERRRDVNASGDSGTGGDDGGDGEHSA